MNITYFGSAAAKPSLADCSAITAMIANLNREIAAPRTEAQVEAFFNAYRNELVAHERASERLVAAAKRQALSDAIKEIRSSVTAIAGCAMVGKQPHLMGGAIAAMVLTDTATMGVQLFLARSAIEQYQVAVSFAGDRVSMYVHLIRGHKDPVHEQIIRCVSGLVNAYGSASQAAINWTAVLRDAENALKEATRARESFEKVAVSNSATREFIRDSFTAQKSFLQAFQAAFQATNCRDPGAPNQTPRPLPIPIPMP